MSDWLRIEMGTAIILALGHFLWQGAVIALITAFALWTTDSPQRRYRWALAGLTRYVDLPTFDDCLVFELKSR